AISRRGRHRRHEQEQDQKKTARSGPFSISGTWFFGDLVFRDLDFGGLAPQLRVACHVPLQRSPVMTPLQVPEPELPTSRPPPLAREAPTETATATLPPRPTEPETRPPPADD